MYIFTDAKNVIVFISEKYKDLGNGMLEIENGLCKEHIKNEFEIIEVAEIPDNVSIQKYKYKNNSFIRITEDKEIELSKAKFLQRLTFEELNALTNYEKIIPITDIEYTQKCMAMKTLWNLFDKFIEVDLSDREWVFDFIQIVVWTGLMTVERADEITN